MGSSAALGMSWFGGGKRGSSALCPPSASLGPDGSTFPPGGSGPTGGAELGGSPVSCPRLRVASWPLLLPTARTSAEGLKLGQVPSHRYEANLAHRARIIVDGARRRRNSLCIEPR